MKLLGVEEIDVDAMVEERARVQGDQTSTILSTTDQPQRACVEPAGKRCKPSWGGRIDPNQLNLFGEDDDRFKCGQ